MVAPTSDGSQKPMSENIIDCDGKYEVHETHGGRWAVVNGERGEVRAEHQKQADAISHAKELNGSDDE